MRDFILVALLALLAFGATLAGTFHFDDYSLFSNPAVVAPDGWTELFRLDQTRPLTMLTFWLNYQAGGRDAAGYHLVNVLLHIGAAVLLLRVARQIVTARAALIAAALFAVHPLATEPVAYIFARPALLMTAFCLLALDTWLRGRIWSALAWFAAALLAKEECAAFPLVLAMLHYAGPRTRRGWVPIAVMLMLALAAGLRVIYALSLTPGAWAGARAGISPGAYLLTQGAVMLRYLRQFVFPWGFSVDPQIGPCPVWMEALAWAVLLAATGFAARRVSTTAAGFWFVAGLVLLAPSSSIFPASDLAADRRMYLSLIAFTIGAGLLLQKADWRIPAVIVAVMCVVSIRYSLLWMNERSLWTEAVRLAPAKVRPRIHLARALDADAALDVMREAEKFAPRDPAVPTEEGRIYLSAGMAPEALSAFGRALALDPSDPKALQNRGAALLALGQVRAARQDFERALQNDPCLFEARLNLVRMGIHEAGAVPSACRFAPDMLAELNGPHAPN